MGNLKGAKKQSIAQDTTLCWQLWSQMPSETFPSALLLWRPHHHTPFARTLTLFLLLFILIWFVFETESYMSQSCLKFTTHLGIRMNFSSSALCLPHIWVIGMYHCALFHVTERSNPGFHRWPAFCTESYAQKIFQILVASSHFIFPNGRTVKTVRITLSNHVIEQEGKVCFKVLWHWARQWWCMP